MIVSRPSPNVALPTEKELDISDRRVHEEDIRQDLQDVTRFTGRILYILSNLVNPVQRLLVKSDAEYTLDLVQK